jgi:hypothetical protein
MVRPWRNGRRGAQASYTGDGNISAWPVINATVILRASKRFQGVSPVSTLDGTAVCAVQAGARQDAVAYQPLFYPALVPTTKSKPLLGLGCPVAIPQRLSESTI